MSRRLRLAGAMVPAALALFSGAARGQTSAMTESNGTWTTTAEQFVRRLERGEYDAAAASVSPAVPAGAMSADRLRTVWAQLTAQMGSLAAIEPRLVTEQGALHVVDLAARFARSEVTTRVVLDDAGHVRGFWISNPQPPAYTSPDYATPASFEEVELAIAGGAGKPLPATLTLPKGVAHPPVVVLVHGSGPNDRDETIGANRPFRDFAWGLASHGIAVLRYDKRTFAHRGELAAPGLTVEQEVVLDALAALAAIRADGRVDAHRVYVAGHSLGGTLAPEIAARDGHVAGAILLAASARPLADVTLEQIAYLRSLGGASGTQSDADYDAVVAQLERVRAHALPDDAAVLGATAGYFYDLARRDPVGRARALRVPVFVAQGGRDYQVTAADLALWRDALGDHAGATVREYPTLNHLFMTGEGKATPAEYVSRTGHVARELVDDVAHWVLDAGGRR